MSIVKTILVVDDCATERLYLSELLHSQGYRVIEAINGSDAYDIAKKNAIDLVIMDIIMPEMNGFKATREFSKDLDLKHIPIVISTGKQTETDKIWAERQGAKGYLIKPIQGQQLFALITLLLNN